MSRPLITISWDDGACIALMTLAWNDGQPPFTMPLAYPLTPAVVVPAMDAVRARFGMPVRSPGPAVTA